MGIDHYNSHLLAQATRDVEAAKIEARRLEQLVAKVESSMTAFDLA